MIKKLYGQFRLLFVDSQNTEASVDQHANLVKPLFWMLIVAGATSLIVFSVDLWFHPKTAASLGTFGDFFGGVLNPIFTFLTFFGLIITIVIQRMELRLAREEYEKTAIALNTQAIENTFFNTLNLHHKIVESLKFDPKIFPDGNHERMLRNAGMDLPVKPTYEGRNVFAGILLELRNNCESTADLHRRYKFIQSEHNHILGHYFRNLYQALKAVDNYPSEMLSSEQKQKYAGILRAQLSSSELALLFLNCLDGMVDEGQFKNLLVRYRMLEHLPLSMRGNLYFLAGSKISISDEETIRQYTKESDVSLLKTVVPKSRGAFGRNDIQLPSSDA